MPSLERVALWMLTLAVGGVSFAYWNEHRAHTQEVVEYRSREKTLNKAIQTRDVLLAFTVGKLPYTAFAEYRNRGVITDPVMLSMMKMDSLYRWKIREDKLMTVLPERTQRLMRAFSANGDTQIESILYAVENGYDVSSGCIAPPRWSQEDAFNQGLIQVSFADLLERDPHSSPLTNRVVIDHSNLLQHSPPEYVVPQKQMGYTSFRPDREWRGDIVPPRGKD